jgi:hypothetical protein
VVGCDVDSVYAEKYGGVRCQCLEFFPGVHGCFSVKFKCVINVKSVMALFGGNDEEQSIEELEASLEEVENERLKAKGQRKLDELKKSKKEEIRRKQAEAKKEKFRQTKAGKLIDRFSSAINTVSENVENNSARRDLNSISRSMESLDGDQGGRDSAEVFLGTQEKPELEKNGVLGGTVEVEGTIEVEDSDGDATDSQSVFGRNEQGLMQGRSKSEEISDELGRLFR